MNFFLHVPAGHKHKDRICEFINLNSLVYTSDNLTESSAREQQHTPRNDALLPTNRRGRRLMAESLL